MQRLAAGFVLNGRYVLESPIASGGMADVWSGLDQVLSRQVALKIMRPAFGHEEVFEHRFRDEARHAASLVHPNIATVFDYGEDDHLMYLVMELIDGKPLSELLRSGGALAPRIARAVLMQSALALAAAHRRGVVHRDVKPGNILMAEDGTVKLTDFGISRASDGAGLTGPGEILGTPNYLSPEQAMGESATAASDLYALGVVGYELLTGAPPFDKGTPVATAIAHVQEPPPPLADWIPDDLRAVIGACLQKEPAQRPAGAEIVAEALGFVARH